MFFSNPAPARRSHHLRDAGPLFRPLCLPAAVPRVSTWRYDEFPLPRDYQEKSEWVFGRLMYPPSAACTAGFELAGNWNEGGSNWTMDYPRSTATLRGRAPPHPHRMRAAWNSPSTWTMATTYDWPLLYGVEVGHWDLTDARRKSCASSCCAAAFSCATTSTARSSGTSSLHSMQKVFPDRPIVDIPNERRHLSHHLRSGRPLPGAGRTIPAKRGRTYEKGETGKHPPHWRGIYDDHGRLMVAICHNMDLGDSWEHADNPQYPEKFSALGIRIALNYIIYSMTH